MEFAHICPSLVDVSPWCARNRAAQGPSRDSFQTDLTERRFFACLRWQVPRICRQGNGGLQKNVFREMFARVPMSFAERSWRALEHPSFADSL